MSESDELYASVNYIKHKVDALEKIEMLNLRSNRQLLDEYLELFEGDSELAEVYKAVNGISSQSEIAGKLNYYPMKVSRKINDLLGNGLIEICNSVGNNNIYKHTVAEKAFKLIDKIK